MTDKNYQKLCKDNKNIQLIKSHTIYVIMYARVPVFMFIQRNLLF